jgi:hypothetical protein
LNLRPYFRIILNTSFHITMIFLYQILHIFTAYKLTWFALKSGNIFFNIQLPDSSFFIFFYLFFHNYHNAVILDLPIINLNQRFVNFPDIGLKEKIQFTYIETNKQIITT